MKFAWSWNAPTLKIAYAEVEAPKMDFQDELKKLQDLIDELIKGNDKLKANVIKVQVQLLRTELASDSSKDAQRIRKTLDGIEKDLDGFIQRLTNKRT